ncbi:trimethyllysine dioxygenase [Talaromyces pinophilus]|uniref:Trimethyllysine dioxygenase n=1 Tax=Talaromyces pinophilus TaxID=128442 RepID=A0A6V8HF41_TALPI|nr:Trimethyllysine dioxygenase [Penicillium occitanis (nom. inval.)]PCH07375.1 hypothetical protein PENOC_019220 [Penicillium occitanis (nom. inval.)]GAM39649.1 trimethyllysine dioxygenase [Talaromyces pinophilus]
MTLPRVRLGNLYRAHALISQKSFGYRRPNSSVSSAWPWKQIRRLSSEIPGASSVPDNPETLKALQNDKSISYTTASPSTQLNSSVHGEEHESTDFVNLDGSENLSEDLLEDPSDLFQPISIRKYETFEDESFYEQVHIKPFNKYPAYWLRKYKHSRNSEFHPSVDFEAVMNTNEGLTVWLQHVIDWGYCLVKGVPVTPEATEKLLKRIAFIRETHYGGFWDFTSDLTFKDTAYTDEALGGHTDNTYFSDPARLQLFHLLEHTQGEGGKTLLVDGFYAAWRMLAEDPQNVEAFTDYAQPWHSSGNEHVSIQPYRHFPVFERDPTSARLLRIRWNNYDRAAKIDWTPAMAMHWYRAARYWNAIISRKSIQKWLQLEPGTALLFDNWRMLHGRSEFTGKRRMCGGYINNDDFVSRFRLLKNGRENVLDEIGTYTTRLSF